MEKIIYIDGSGLTLAVRLDGHLYISSVLRVKYVLKIVEELDRQRLEREIATTVVLSEN